MADITDLFNQILSRLDEQGRDIKSVKQDVSTIQKDVATLTDTQQKQGSEIKAIRREHGEKLDRLDGKVDRLEDGQNRQHTILKVIEGAIKETKAEVDKLLRRPRQAD